MVSRALPPMVEMRNEYRVLVGTHVGKNHLGDLSVYRMVILKLILNKLGLRV
jgi:hypothetical protein